MGKAAPVDYQEIKSAFTDLSQSEPKLGHAKIRFIVMYVSVGNISLDVTFTRFLYYFGVGWGVGVGGGDFTSPPDLQEQKEHLQMYPPNTYKAIIK